MVQKSCHTFTWTIEDFELQYVKPDDKDEFVGVSSPSFVVTHPDEVSTTTWYKSHFQGFSGF